MFLWILSSKIVLLVFALHEASKQGIVQPLGRLMWGKVRSSQKLGIVFLVMLNECCVCYYHNIIAIVVVQLKRQFTVLKKSIQTILSFKKFKENKWNSRNELVALWGLGLRNNTLWRVLLMIRVLCWSWPLPEPGQYGGGGWSPTVLPKRQGKTHLDSGV